jgi:hypothetical protein
MFIVPSLQAGPVYRSMLHAAAALISAFRVQIELIVSLAAVSARLAIGAQEPPL